jgi:hypothetical protein
MACGTARPSVVDAVTPALTGPGVVSIGQAGRAKGWKPDGWGTA